MKKGLLLALTMAIGWSLIGCNIGMSPSGGSDAQVKEAFDKMPLEERAKSIMGSPAPMDHKKKMIEDMYAKEGKKVPDTMFNSGSTAH